MKDTVDRAEVVSAVRDDIRHRLSIGHIGPEDQNLSAAIFAGNELSNDTRLIRAVRACRQLAPRRFWRKCPTTYQRQPGFNRSSQEACKVERDIAQSA